MSIGLALYGLGTRAIAPLLPLWANSRVKSGKENPEVLDHRFARALPERRAGRLIWLHGASVGEFSVVRALIEAISEATPSVSFLVSSQTRTARDLFLRHPTPRSDHVMAPFDTSGAAKRFVEHFRPDLAVFAEGEIWPNLLDACKVHGVKTALVNARMTDRSISGWSKWRSTSRAIFQKLDLMLAADERTGTGLTAISGRPIRAIGNIKEMIPPPAADEDNLSDVKAIYANRCVVVAASTHAGEETLIQSAFDTFRESEATASLIIVPRHPERGASIAEAISRAGLQARLRSRNEPPDPDRPYIADTLGEMGLWFRIADAVYLGGGHAKSVGGHNPIEPILLGRRVVSGPRTH
ncbi:MAG: glycosyltransferase N-terminal domain-containing protein, partial [Pseudomonadota bacterium]